MKAPGAYDDFYEQLRRLAGTNTSSQRELVDRIGSLAAKLLSLTNLPGFKRVLNLAEAGKLDLKRELPEVVTYSDLLNYIRRQGVPLVLEVATDLTSALEKRRPSLAFITFCTERDKWSQPMSWYPFLMAGLVRHREALPQGSERARAYDSVINTCRTLLGSDPTDALQIYLDLKAGVIACQADLIERLKEVDPGGGVIRLDSGLRGYLAKRERRLNHPNRLPQDPRSTTP